MNDDSTTAATHDWHVGTDGMELLIRSDAADSVGVHLGHENIDDAHATVIITSRLLEMIDAVQPGAVRDHLREQEPTDAEVEAAAREMASAAAGIVAAGPKPWEWWTDRNQARFRKTARAALSAARAARRDEEKR